MHLNKIFKGLLVALPVLAITACGSTSSTSAGEGASTSTSSQQTSTVENEQNTTEVAVIERTATPEEEMRKKFEQLRREHIVYFDFDKATVSGEFAELLQAHADFLVKNDSVKVLIEGHADERGTPEYNIALGERRAKAVSQYLQNLGVMNSQISIVSYGEEKPLDKSRSEAAFAKNRRAVLVY
ncbi:peptidoglycan-associated lipoprotein Pal [Flocculibacter collagenilyticus]|uniref:peptidoglycan-associated lipoprotein Pal n=1 Tax=Flocculibacter collagenilyticus TaxID=2744479 RepID=UPI0018F3B9EE|nr:peptidoglycan-associated lipoprotein Pal [Flocculibacter collagenilyticus]